MASGSSARSSSTLYSLSASCKPASMLQISGHVLTTIIRRVAIIVAITIPRVPSFSLNERQALSPATGAFNRSVPTIFSRLPANFSFPAFSSLQVDTTGNYVPITFNSVHAQVFDLDSNRKIGTGYMGRKRLPAKSFPVIQVPLNFSYVADNDTDPTCKSCFRLFLFLFF